MGKSSRNLVFQILAIITSIYFFQNCGSGFNTVYDPVNHSDLSSIAPESFDWFNTDIGSPNLSGGLSVDGQIFNIQGNGTDIYGNNDQFHFVYKSFNGDLEILSQFNSLIDTNEWAKMGLMIREDLDSDSPHALITIHPEEKRQFIYRATKGAITSNNNSLQNGRTELWLKLIRSGNTISGLISNDGVTWELISSQEIIMPASVLVGIAVTSKNTEAMTTAELNEPIINGFQQGMRDTDGDGLPDSIDPDDDNDGIPDTEDSYPTDKNRGGAIDGVQLYTSYCAGCHGDLNNSQKRNATVNAITNAILVVQDMKDLFSELNADEIAAISLALSTTPPAPVPDPPPPSPTGDSDPRSIGLDFRAQLGTRSFFMTKFEEIFVADTNRNQDDQTILNIIKDLIKNSITAFGGPCTHYDLECVWEGSARTSKGGLNRPFIDTLAGSVHLSANASITPKVNPLRKAYSQRLCEEVLTVDKSVSNALFKIGLNINSPASDNNIRSLESLFFAGRTLDTTARQALKNIHSSATKAGQSNQDGWRFIMFSMCQSSFFEVL